MADNDHKADPVSPSALIQVGGTNFSGMRGVDQLRSVEASAPAFHGAALRSLIKNGKVRDDTVQQERVSNVVVPKSSKLKFGLGAIARTSDGKKVTIIQASAGYTAKSKTPVHKVADRNGRVWLEKESNLRLVL